MKILHRCWWTLTIAGAAMAVQPAELTLAGNRLLVSGMLDGSAVQNFLDHLRRGNVRTVVFENSLGGTAEAAGLYAQAIRDTGVSTELIGQCYAACAYAYLAGKVHRFGEGEQVNALLIPVGTRPKPGELASRWRGEEAHKTLAEFTAPGTPDGEVVNVEEGTPKEKWRPEHGVLFTATPTLFGRVYNTYYCDGTQGRDLTRCELLSDADPRKLGVITD
ncbi:MAG TPA: hypothetical protein VLJ19_16000 [Variovorax sp.]|nr:hypothetical protein [Variovorax sp.]